MKKNTTEKSPFGSQKIDLRVAGLSLSLAILLHVFVLIFAPRNFALMANQTNNYEDFELEFELPEIEKIIPEFIEANPAANSDMPENDTPYESFKNQKAAQETLEVAQNSNTPKIDGEKEESHKVVSGNLQEEVLMQSPEAVFETLERPLTNPSEPATKNVVNQNIQDAKETAQAEIPEPPPSENSNEPMQNQDGELPANNKDFLQKIETEQVEEVAQEPLPMPKPRPHLSLQTAAGPLKKNNLNANSIGVTAVDSRFSEFGAYEQRMSEAIARQWYLLASMQSLSSEVDTQVVVEFFLNTDGEITSIKVLFNTSTITGRSLCEQAILSTAPYGKWTPEMIATFGSQDQAVKFTFYYR